MDIDLATRISIGLMLGIMQIFIALSAYIVWRG